MGVLLWYRPCDYSLEAYLKCLSPYLRTREHLLLPEENPLDLLDRYGGKRLIKVNLKTNDLKQVAKQVAALNKQYESSRSALRNNYLHIAILTRKVGIYKLIVIKT